MHTKNRRTYMYGQANGRAQAIGVPSSFKRGMGYKKKSTELSRHIGIGNIYVSGNTKSSDFFSIIIENI